MEYDRDQVDEMVLALLYLNTFDEDEFGAGAWRSHDWDADGPAAREGLHFRS